MGGILWSTWRSVRGVDITYQFRSYARWSHSGFHEMWRDHITLGIAEDGRPTGIEHAFRFESFQPDLVMLRSRWDVHAGARKLRELYLATNDREQLVAATHDAALDRSKHPVCARAFDLDLFHALAETAPSLGALVARWTELPGKLVDVAMPPCLANREVCTHAVMAKALDERRARLDATERALLAQIEAEPRNEGALVVYGDWLETAGRIAEATLVRERLG